MSHIVGIIILTGKEFNIGIQGQPHDQTNHKVPSKGLDPKCLISQASWKIETTFGILTDNLLADLVE